MDIGAKRKADREAAIRETLLYVCGHDSLPPGTEQDEVSRIIKLCVDEEYLRGVKVVETLDGSARVFSRRPVVTQKGMEFLSREPGERIADGLEALAEQMRKDHAEQEAEKAKDRRFELFNTLAGAVAGAAATLIVEHWGEIISFFRGVFKIP